MNDPQPSSPIPAASTPPGQVSRPLMLLRHCDIAAVVTTWSGQGLVVLSPVLTPTRTITGPDGGSLRPEPCDRRCGLPVPDRVHVFAEDAGLTTRDADERVTPVEDSDRQAVLLGDALADLAYHHDQALAAERDRTARQHVQLASVRKVLIDRHRDGHLPTDQLADLLAAAGLAPYRPRLRVTFTLTGSYDVPGTAADLPDVRRRTRRLLVDFTDIDDHVTTTADLTVHVDDITLIDQ